MPRLFSFLGGGDMPTRRRRTTQANQAVILSLDLARVRSGVALVQLVRTRKLQRCLWRLMAHLKEREMYWMSVIDARPVPDPEDEDSPDCG